MHLRFGLNGFLSNVLFSKFCDSLQRTMDQCWLDSYIPYNASAATCTKPTNHTIPNVFNNDPVIAYNKAVVTFEQSASSSTIYAIVYLTFIPISHAIISLLVFGWPEHYVRSLMSNAPVGLTAIVLGAALTAYLDEIEFNTWVADAATQYRAMLGYTIPSAGTADGKPLSTETPSLQDKASRGGGEFYSSLFVLIVTGIWTFVLSVMVNAPAESSEKKEL